MMTDDDGWSLDPAERQAPGFPPGVNELFEVLWQELCGFSAKWNLYLDLFGTEKTRDVLSDTAPGAFELIESALRNDMTMSLGRMMDPATTGGKQNLSIERLLAVLKSSCPPALHDSWVHKLQEIRAHAAPFKELRNRMIGHTDLRTALASTADPTMAVARPHVAKARTLIAELLNKISVQYTGTSHLFERVFMHGNGEDLIFYLKTALEHFADEERRMRGTCK